MFDSRPASTESKDTLFNPGSTHDADPGFAAPLLDAGRGRHAGPRDPRGSRLPDIYRCGRLNRGKGGLGEV